MWDKEKLHIIRGFSFSCNVWIELCCRHIKLWYCAVKRLNVWLRLIQQPIHENISIVEIVYNKRFSILWNLFSMQCNEHSNIHIIIDGSHCLVGIKKVALEVILSIFLIETVFYMQRRQQSFTCKEGNSLLHAKKATVFYMQRRQQSFTCTIFYMQRRQQSFTCKEGNSFLHAKKATVFYMQRRQQSFTCTVFYMQRKLQYWGENRKNKTKKKTDID